MKKIWITGKQWRDPVTFVKDFPFAKLPLVMLWIDSQIHVSDISLRAPDPIYKGAAVLGFVQPSPAYPGARHTRALLGIDTFKYQQTINAYRDVIRFAVSPEFPLTITFQPKRIENVLNIIRQNTNSIWSSGAVRMLLYQYIANKDRLKSAGLLKAEAVNPPDKPFAELLSLKDRIIDIIFKYAFVHFQINTQSGWSDFNEVYGKFNSIDQIPRNTIGYTVVEKGPPVKKVNWENVEFWSKVFSSTMGSAILNAVAGNFPVRLNTRVEEWKNPNKPEIKVALDNLTTISFYKYVFQDFQIEIGTKGNILVKYNRGLRTLTFKETEQQDLWWEKYVAYVAIAVIAVITWGAGSGLAAGAGVGAGGTTAGAATGVTFGVEAGVGIGGASAWSGVAAGVSTVAGTAGTGASIAASAGAGAGESTITAIAPNAVTSVAGGANTGTAIVTSAGAAESATGIAGMTTGQLLTGGTTVIGAAGKLMSGGGSSGSGGGTTGDSSLLSDVVGIAKPLINVGGQIYSTQQAKKMQEEQGYDMYAEGILPTIQGVNQYQPVTGTVPGRVSEAGMFGGIPIQWVLISGGVLSLIYLMTQKQSGMRR